MAEGFLKHLAGDRFEAYSAGVEPTDEIHPCAVEALREVRPCRPVGVGREGGGDEPASGPQRGAQLACRPE